MVSDRVRNLLLDIACRSDDDIVHAWGDIRVGLDDARDLCECIELTDVVQGIIDRHGENAPRMIRTFIRLMMHPSSVETVQFTKAPEETK